MAYTNTIAGRAARSVSIQVASKLVSAIEADTKSTFQIAKDAGIKHSDLLQFLGDNDNTGSEPYTKAQKTCSLEWAAQVTQGLTDPTPFTINLGFEMSPTSGTLTAGTHDVAYAGVTFALTNGAAPFTYEVATGTLPAGLSLNSTTGSLTGTPTVAGTSNFTIRGTDRNGNTSQRAYSLTVA